MVTKNTVSGFVTRVCIQIIDNEGNILNDIVDTNSETLWAKLNTPVTGTLYLDFITKDSITEYGVSLSELAKTANSVLTELRANILTTAAFTLSNKVYTINFNWYNNTTDPVILTGLLSYNTTYVYSIFDLSLKPITVTPGSTVIGTYKITYDNETPVLSTIYADNELVLTDVNQTYVLAKGGVDDQIKAYKLSRIFTKTSIYVGVDITDTGFMSSVEFSTSYTENVLTNYYREHTGEIFYKCTISGSVEGATIQRFLIHPNCRMYGIVGENTIQPIIRSNVPYTINIAWQNLSNEIVEYRAYYMSTPISSMCETAVPIYPHKIIYISNPTDIEPHIIPNSSMYNHQIKWSAADIEYGVNQDIYMLYNRYQGCSGFSSSVTDIVSTTYVYDTVYCQIMYWDTTPTLIVYCVMYTQSNTETLYFYLDGVQVPAIKTELGVRYGTKALAKYEVDVTSLPSSGNAILYIKGHSIVTSSAFYIETIMFCTNMYSYIVPYAGMFTANSSEITSGWISSSCLHTGGFDIVSEDPIMDDVTIAAISKIQNTSISEMMLNTKWQYNISVTVENKNKVAGIIHKGNTGIIVGNAITVPRYYYGMMSNLLPYYVSDSNYVHFGMWSMRNISSQSSGLFCKYINPAYINSIYSNVCNTSIQIDTVNKIVTYLNGKAYMYGTDELYLDTLKSYIFREQGTDNYRYTVPSNMCNYVEGSPTVAWEGKVYEFETTLQQVENIGHIQITTNTNSIFASNEYVSFPYCSEHYLPIDALETWDVTSIGNIPKTVFDDYVSDKYSNADELINTHDTVSTNVFNNIGSNTGEILSCEIISPLTTMEVEGNQEYTHIFTFEVSYNADSTAYPIIHIPKKFIYSGNALYTNVQSAYATDGLHVIPWSLSPDISQRNDNSNVVTLHNWKLVLNRENIAQLYSENTTILIYVYVQAKIKTEWLPFDVDIRNIYNSNKYIDNNGVNTLLLISSNNIHGDTQIVNSSKLSSSLYIESVGVIHSTSQSKFTSSSLYFSNSESGYMSISGIGTTSNRHGIGTITGTNDLTIDFWMYISVLPSSNIDIIDIYDNSTSDRYLEITNQHGIRIYLKTSGCFEMIYNELLYPINLDNANSLATAFKEGDDTTYVTINQWNHVAFVISNGFIQLFFNGRSKGVHPLSLRGTVANLRLFNNYIGYVSEFHITKGVIWIDEFIPPSYPWGDSNLDTQGIQYIDEALIPIELPVALDSHIDIVNGIDNSHIDYLHADPYNRRIEGNALSNIFYLKASDIKLVQSDTIKISYIKYPLRGRNHCAELSTTNTETNGGIHGVYMGVEFEYDKMIKSAVMHSLDYNPHRTLSTITPGTAYGFITNNKYINLNYKFKQTINITDTSCANIKIITSEINNSSSHTSIFVRYLTGTELTSSLYQTINPTYTNVSDTYDSISSINNSGIKNFTRDVFANMSAANNLIVDIRSKNSYISVFSYGILTNTPMVGACTYTKNSDMLQKNIFQFAQYPLHNGAINYNNILNTGHLVVKSDMSYTYAIMISSDATISNYDSSNIYASLSAYCKTKTMYSPEMLLLSSGEPGYNTHVNVDCVSATDIPLKRDGGYGIINSTLISISNISNPNKFKYTTNKSITPGDTSVFKIDNQKILSADNIDIITYAPTAYTYKYSPYTNSTGVHILSLPINTINYTVLLSNKFMDNSHMAYKYGYTKNTELITLLNTQQLKTPYTVGYVSDTYEYSDTIEKNTVYEISATNTLLFEFPVFGVRQTAIGSLIGLEKSAMAAYRDIYVGSNTDVSTYFMDNIRHFTYVVNNFQRHLWPDVRITSNTQHTGMCFTQYPYFNTYNIDELYINTHFISGAWDISTQSNVIGNTSAPIYFNLSPGTQEYKTGNIINEALHVDSRIVAKSNVYHNIIFDSANIPIDSINRIGKFSIRLYTSEYGDGQITYVPIIKVTNTNTMVVTTYVMHTIYNTLLDISNSIGTITDDNITVALKTAKKNNFTYEDFNSLLSQYTGSEYILNLGVIVYSSVLNMLCAFKGMSIEIDFSDTTKYTRPDWCYYNDVVDIMSSTKTALISDITTHKIKVYNPNNTNAIDYSLRLDVSKYDFSLFTNGIVAKTPTNVEIPTLYEIDDDGHISNELSLFNDKGIWVKIPVVEANASIELTLYNLVNSYVSDDIFLFYEGFDTFDTVNMQYSKLYQLLLTWSEHDGGIGFESWSERGLYVDHTLSINVLDNTLQITGQESTSVITTSSTLSNTALYEILYNAKDDDNLEIAFGALTNIAYNDPLPYYNENVDTDFTFIKTDLHEGDNYFYVYYESGTATDNSTTSIFNTFQDFSDISTPGWLRYNTSNMNIIANEMSVTNTRARIQASNAIASEHSFGVLCRIKASTVSINAIIAGVTVNDTAYSVLSCGKFDTLRYITDITCAHSSVGVLNPISTYSSYIMNVHQNNYVKVDQYTAKVSNGCYYVTENEIGSSQRAGAATEAFFNLGGTWDPTTTTLGGYDSSDTTAMTYTLAVMYKAPSSILFDPELLSTEQGSWTIDTHVFTKRSIIKIVATSNDINVVIRLNRVQFNNATNIRITNTTKFSVFSKNTNALTFKLCEHQNIIGLNSTTAVTTEIIPYWYDFNDTENAFIKTDIVVGTNNIYVYYNSGTATDMINGNEVFEFYDNFSLGILDASKWHIVGTLNSSYTVASYAYTALITPACIRSHYLLIDKYNIMLRGSVDSTNYENSLLSIWNNAVDFYGIAISSNLAIAFKYNSTSSIPTAYEGNACTLNNSGTPATIIVSNNYTSNNRYSMYFYGTTSAIERVFTTMYYAQHNRTAYSDYIGHIHIGSSLHYPNASNKSLHTTCNWVASWRRSTIQYDYIWGIEETGSWTVDGYVFTNRKKLTIESDDTDTNVVIKLKQYAFSNQHNIRIIREIRTGTALRYIDTHRTDTLLSFVPSDNDVMYSRTLLDDKYNMSDIATSLPISTPNTGKIGITACTGTHTDKVTIKWIRSRKYYEKSLAQLKMEDVSLLITNLNSDWYLINTTTTIKAADTNAILTAIYNNTANNHDSVFLERWKDFPKSDLVKNGHYGFGRHICYRN